MDDNVAVEQAAEPRRAEVWAFCARHHHFQGDTRVRGDEPVTDAQLIGRVVEVDPYRTPVRWGALAGGLQRTPRVAVAVAARRWRGRR